MILALYDRGQGVETGPGTRAVYDVARGSAHFGEASVEGHALVWELQGGGAEDALLAAEHGAAAVVVSNHGGCQLDGVPEVAAAVLNKKVRTGAPLRLAGLADSTGGPAFSAAAGLLSFALQHHAVAAAQPAVVEAPASRIGRIGSWIRENF